MPRHTIPTYGENFVARADDDLAEIDSLAGGNRTAFMVAAAPVPRTRTPIQRCTRSGKRRLPTASSEIRRRDVWLVNLDPTVGSQIRKTHPCVIIQRDAANDASPTTIVCPISSARTRTGITHVKLEIGNGGLQKESVVVCNQLKAVDRARLVRRLGTLSTESMKLVDRGVLAILDLSANHTRPIRG